MKSSKRQFLVTVTGYGYFATKAGGRVAADVARVYDGGSLRPELMSGPAQAENITVSRPYDPLRDGPMLAALRQRVGIYETDIIVQATDRSLVKIGGASPVTYPKALLVGLDEPDYDAQSADPGMVQLEFAISDFV